jgi:Arm domain-containing DNA-binding protein/integrase-like protein
MELRTEKPEITAKNYLSVGPGEYPCGNNLYLIITPSGGRRWAFRYQRNGIVKKMGFGSAKAAGLKLSEAKDKAIDALRLLAKGTDPREHRNDEKRRAQGSRLFGEFAEEWRETYETGLKHKAARNKLRRIVQVICKPLHKLQLDEIETEHVIAVLRKVWHQREVSRDTSRRFWTRP